MLNDPGKNRMGIAAYYFLQQGIGYRLSMYATAMKKKGDSKKEEAISHAGKLIG